MKFVRKGHKVGRIRKDGMEERGGCLWAGIFGTESAVRKRGGSRNLPYLNAKPRQIPLLGTYACTVTRGA